MAAPGRPLGAIVGLVVLALLGWGCSHGRAPVDDGPPMIDSAGEALPDLEERALMLLLADRGLYEPFTVQSVLAGGPELREELALVLGRIPDERSRAVLEELLLDPEPRVRRAAAFSLGILGMGAQSTISSLYAAAGGLNEGTGLAAVEALARLGAPLAQVRLALSGLAEEDAQARLMPSLYRFAALEALPVARAVLAGEVPGSRRWAALAMSRNPVREAVRDLRALLSDEDPRIRAWAARGLGRIGSGVDMTLLLAATRDTEPAPVIESLRSGRLLIATGRAAPPDDWRSRLLELMQDPRQGVRITALEASQAWLLDAALGQALLDRVDDGAGWERQVALLALAGGGDDRAVDRARLFAVSSNADLRVLAAAAAGRLGLSDLSSALFADPQPRVRVVALEAILSLDSPAVSRVVEVALRDADPGVRALALTWLTDHPVVGDEQLLAALAQSATLDIVDLPIHASRALTARALAQPLERGGIIASLEVLAQSRAAAVREAANEGLQALGADVAAPPTAGNLRVATYRDIVRRTREVRFADLLTQRGRVRLRLACPELPMTCFNFLRLAEQGFYDGLKFHRVVPDFVVQGGDPRGDGWGGPGYAVRDEAGLQRFGEGVIGMALSAPDTAGSQFFITLAPQPHLEGTFTAFGVVTEGMSILREVAQGERILEIREAYE